MATIINKMFNIVQPDVAVFGEKDYQQLAVIHSMVRHLNHSHQSLGEPTVRASDGLALLCRNRYFNDQERAATPIPYQCLNEMALSLQNGHPHVERLLDEHRKRIIFAGFQLEYLEMKNAQDLAVTSEINSHLVILVTARLAKTRLIDNVVVRVNDLTASSHRQ